MCNNINVNLILKYEVHKHTSRMSTAYALLALCEGNPMQCVPEPNIITFFFKNICNSLTYCGLVMPYGIITLTGFEISNWMHLSVGQVDCKNHLSECTIHLSDIYKANATYVKIRNMQSSIGQVLQVFHLSDCHFYTSQDDQTSEISNPALSQHWLR